MQEINKNKILVAVTKALECQFDCGYSWCDMIDDIRSLTIEEKEWAKEHTTYSITYSINAEEA